MPNLPHPDEPELTIDESLIEGGYEVVVFPDFFLVLCLQIKVDVKSYFIAIFDA